jgi:hypothetical protein
MRQQLEVVLLLGHLVSESLVNFFSQCQYQYFNVMDKISTLRLQIYLINFLLHSW